MKRQSGNILNSPFKSQKRPLKPTSTSLPDGEMKTQNLKHLDQVTGQVRGTPATRTHASQLPLSLEHSHLPASFSQDSEAVCQPAPSKGAAQRGNVKWSLVPQPHREEGRVHRAPTEPPQLPQSKTFPWLLRLPRGHLSPWARLFCPRTKITPFISAEKLKLHFQKGEGRG